MLSGNRWGGTSQDGTTTLAVDHSSINGNGDGGVVLESEDTATIETSTLDSNAGAGVVVDDPAASATVRTSTVSNTVPITTTEGEPFGAGVLAFFGGTATIDTSTIFGNTGQGVLSESGVVTIRNSTVSGTAEPSPSSSLSGGGVVAVSLRLSVAPGRAANRRFPTGAKPAVITNQPSAPAAPSTTLTGTVVADNTTLHDCVGTVDDGGYNLASDGSCAFSATGSVENGTAKLGPLADNGGPTKTLLPAKGSQAMDAIPTGKANCSTTATDQRGVSRPQGARCDIGAVEVDQPTIVISPDSLPHGKVGKTYSQTVTATGGLGAPYVWSLAPDSGALPPGLSFSAGGVISGTPTKAGTYPITVSVDDPKQKDYVIVIDAAAVPSTSPTSSRGTEPIADTGAKGARLTSMGVAAVVAGLLVLFGAGLVGRRAGRHRAR